MFIFIKGSPVNKIFQNRGTTGVQIPFHVPQTLDFKAFQTKVRVLPWQMNNIFIIVLFLLVLPRNALFCKGFWGYCDMLWNYRLWQIRAELSMLLLLVSSKISSTTERLTTKNFLFFYLALFFDKIIYKSWTRN